MCIPVIGCLLSLFETLGPVLSQRKEKKMKEGETWDLILKIFWDNGKIR